MSDVAMTRSGTGHGRAALALGTVALLLFVGGGFAVGGIFWLLGSVAGVIAIIVGVVARRQGGGTEAIVGVILGAIPALWFASYMIVAAFD
ncbi:hypothetical protein [Gaiella sp.]|uniref:hypothetical protein n=1 Tax=Gaiella sp. TaxID=2663207 RepID=UPI0032638449